MRRGVHNKREMGVLPLGCACSGVHLILGNGGCMLRGVFDKRERGGHLQGCMLRGVPDIGERGVLPLGGACSGVYLLLGNIYLALGSEIWENFI